MGITILAGVKLYTGVEMGIERYCYSYNVDNVEGDFRILHACDLHLTPLMPLQNRKTLNLLSLAIDHTRPHLVVINGDLVWTMYNKQMLCEFAGFMEQKGVYWAYALGNHDVGLGRSKYKFVNVLKGYPHSIFLRGEDDVGMGNYFVLLVKNNRPTFSLGLLDTSRGQLDIEQREWYVQALDKIDNLAGRKVNNITFMHIPLPALKVLKGNRYSGYITKRICALSDDSGFFDAVQMSKNTVGIFNGHDHVNNFFGVVDNVLLYSALAGGYGAFNKHKLDRGYVCIDVDMSTGRVDTHCVFEHDLITKKQNKKI